MTITGKLFGQIGNAALAATAPTSETARPGYGVWYARQMARSYESSRRRAATVVTLLRMEQSLALPLAA